jgi:hypothetical protein
MRRLSGCRAATNSGKKRDRGGVAVSKWLDEVLRRENRRRRIRLHTTADFLAEPGFRAAMNMTRQQLALAKRRGEVFSLPIGHARYYPAVLTKGGRQQHRLRRLVRALGPQTPPWLALNFFESRWANLRERTPMQAIRRGDLFFDAREHALDDGELYRLEDRPVQQQAPAVAPAETEDDKDSPYGYPVLVARTKSTFK